MKFCSYCGKTETISKLFKHPVKEGIAISVCDKSDCLYRHKSNPHFKNMELKELPLTEYPKYERI